MEARAVVLEEPERIASRSVRLTPPDEGDVVVDVEFSGISTGTERLLWSGRMPPFPGLGYPLVPGYESVGRVVDSRGETGLAVGERVFVPGAVCFEDVHALFGGAASRLVVPAARVLRVPGALEQEATLFALTATAEHAIRGGETPDLIVGHGVLGRLLARLAVVRGAEPVVWETNERRRDGADGYRVVHPDDDDRRDYRAIYDASGDAGLLDTLIQRLVKGGQICLAGFYEERVSFAFPLAFMREASLRIAAEWRPADLEAVGGYLDAGKLSLDGLITHRSRPADAADAYRTAFEDPSCLKMLLDWRDDA